jgi:hypothetical protein
VLLDPRWTGKSSKRRFKPAVASLAQDNAIQRFECPLNVIIGCPGAHFDHSLGKAKIQDRIYEGKRAVEGVVESKNKEKREVD